MVSLTHVMARIMAENPSAVVARTNLTAMGVRLRGTDVVNDHDQNVRRILGQIADGGSGV